MRRPSWNSVNEGMASQCHRGHISGVRVLANWASEGSRPELREGCGIASKIVGLMYLGHGLGVAGARAEGHEVLEEMHSSSQHRHVPPEYIAIVYEGLGERDRALQWFEKAYAEHSMNGWLLPDPRLDSIRSEPRFKDIMRRMGLPQ